MSRRSWTWRGGSEAGRGHVPARRAPMHVLLRTVLLGLVMIAGTAAGTRAAGSPAGRSSIPTGRPSVHTGETRTAHPPAVSSFYVSPTGNDRNPGTARAPFRSLIHAREVVRRLNHHMTGDITYLERGTYRLTKPLQLDARDSGSNGHAVIWRAMPGQEAVISGAERITGWTLHDSARGIWAAPIPHTLRTRQLYVNGMRAVLAAGPVPGPLTRTDTGYVAASPIMASWRHPGDLDFVYPGQLGLMAEPRCLVASIHGRTITMAQPCWDNATKRSTINRNRQNLVGFGTLTTPAYIENAYELLDQPGEFYLDKSAHTLFYRPRQGEDLRKADVEAPVLQALIQGGGTAREPLRHVTFAHLQFSYATWLQPSSAEGFAEIQANYTVTGQQGHATEGLCHVVPHGTCPYGAWTKEPGAVQLHDDRHLTFLDDRFVHLGAAGLNLDNGSQEATITGSVFTDISGNGLEIGNVNLPDATGAQQTRDISARDNHLYGLPVEYHGGVGILVGYAAHTTIAHNQLDHLAYTAISIGWGGWLDKIGQPAVPNFSRDNVIADNRIFDFMQVLTDGGGIYTQGIAGPSLGHGETVSGNVIHDQLAWGRALLSDDGATYVTYTQNVLYNDTYDYCCTNHINYRQNSNLRHRQYFSQVVRGNYWQQGDSDSSEGGATERENTLIAGPEQVPSAILVRAGIEARYRSVLAWRPQGESIPNPPSQVSVLYAFNGRAYVTWRPSLVAGNSPVRSYAVTVCSVGVTAHLAACKRPMILPDSEFMRLGYAVVPGLADGAAYTVTITAISAGGASTPSLPSAAATVSGHQPPLPGPPTGVLVHPGPHCIVLSWYAPTSAHAQPVLAYIVKDQRGYADSVTGLRQLIMSNDKGKALRVLDGLHGGLAYRFTIAAVTPAGVGPVVTSPAARPQG